MLMGGVQAFCNGVLLNCKGVARAANELAVAGVPESGPKMEIASTANAQEWKRLAQYGDWTNSVYEKLKGKTVEHTGAVQRFGRTEADKIVASFKGTFAKLKRAVTGGTADMPIYEGHPDEPSFAANGHDNLEVYGHVTDLEARADGLYGLVNWASGANALLSSGKLFFSPRWLMRADTAGQVWHPFRLLSFGLTPTPAIFGNAANAEPTNNMTPEELKLLLAALGLAETATPADAIAKAKALAETKTEAEPVTAANALLATEKAAHEATKGKLTTAEASAANARKLFADAVVDRALGEGRVLAANKEQEVTALIGATDLAVAANALLTKKPVVKTEAKSAVLQRTSEALASAANAAGVFQGKVTEIMTGQSCSYDEAWERAKTAHAEIYRKMSE
jgi:hypothetical protein